MVKVTIPDQLAGDLRVYAENCYPEELTIDEVAEELIRIGIDFMTVQLRTHDLLKKNPNAT